MREFLVSDLFQCGNLPPARFTATRRHIGHLVPAQHGGGGTHVINLAESLLQFFQLRFHYITSSNNPLKYSVSGIAGKIGWSGDWVSTLTRRTDFFASAAASTTMDLNNSASM